MVGAISLGAAATPAGATSERPLSSVLLPNALPGYVAEPEGALNGPLSPTLVYLLGSVGDVGATHVSSGDLIGYVRTWRLLRSRGDVIEVVALRFLKSSELPAYLFGFRAGEEARGSTAFAVPGLAGADAYIPSSATTHSRHVVFVASFGRGDTGYAVFVTSATGKLTDATDLALARLQASRAPGSVVWPFAALAGPVIAKIGIVLGGIVVAMLALIGLYLVAARRRYASMPAASVEAIAEGAGWYGTGVAGQAIFYWDGRRWTTERSLLGTEWLDAPSSGPPSGAPDVRRLTQ